MPRTRAADRAPPIRTPPSAHPTVRVVGVVRVLQSIHQIRRESMTLSILPAHSDPAKSSRFTKMHTPTPNLHPAAAFPLAALTPISPKTTSEYAPKCSGILHSDPAQSSRFTKMRTPTPHQPRGRESANLVKFRNSAETHHFFGAVWVAPEMCWVSAEIVEFHGNDGIPEFHPPPSGGEMCWVSAEIVEFPENDGVPEFRNSTKFSEAPEFR